MMAILTILNLNRLDNRATGKTMLRIDAIPEPTPIRL
jgi:hypothetical protein